MRSADVATAIRILLIIPIIYAVTYHMPAWIPVTLLLLSVALDAIDGYLAVREASKGKVSVLMYLSYTMGDKSHAATIKKYKAQTGKSAKYGPRIDVAGDRITEYSLWALFTYLGLVPLIVFVLVIMRHSLVDAMMGAKGTSSRMKTGIAEFIYSSNIMRSGINVVKFVTFSYLMLVYLAGYPVYIGNALVVLLVAYIMVRGAAEFYESIESM